MCLIHRATFAKLITSRITKKKKRKKEKICTLNQKRFFFNYIPVVNAESTEDEKSCRPLVPRAFSPGGGAEICLSWLT